MKVFTVLFLFGLLCKAIDAASGAGDDKGTQNKHRVSFSVEATFKSYQKKVSKCERLHVDNSWKEGVQDHYNGCRTTSWLFSGKAYELSNTAVTTLEGSITKLIYFANVNSTVVAPCSTAILKSMSRACKLNRSDLNIIFEFEKIVLIMIEEFNEVVRKLSDHIGEISCAFTNAAHDLGVTFFQFMRDFLASCRLYKCKKRVDNKPLLRKTQKLMNTLALIGETLLNECENQATQEVYESVLVLHLIFYYFTTAVPGINSCYLNALSDRNCIVTKSSMDASVSLDSAVLAIHQAMSAVTYPYNDTIKDLITVFGSITKSFNTALINIFGLFDGAEITVGEIVKNLVKDDKVKISLVKGRVNIIRGVVSKQTINVDRQ